MVMPANVTIDVERKLVITDCAGMVTDAEFLEARRQLLADPDFDPSFDRLWDFSAVTEERVSAETLAHLVATSPHHDAILRAVVVSMAPQTLSRVMDFVSQSRKYNRQIAAFPTRKSAEEWLERERSALLQPVG
ncbi:MAG: hypothetical protein ABI992_07845 [Chthoniobacterales bacterium]